jgi:hypothetical protein
MNKKAKTNEYLTSGHKETIAAVRDRLQSVHDIDTSRLNDIEMMARMAVIVEIVKLRNEDNGDLLQVLDEISGKFLDLNALIMEIATVVEDSPSHPR